MLPSWRETYIAVLGGNRVGLCRRQGREVEWLGSCGFDADQQPLWVPALAALEQLLLERASAPASLQLLLSASHTRFFLVPWRAQISSTAELHAFARLNFDDVYGARGEHWQLCLSPEASGLPRLASALEAGVIPEALRVAASCGLKLVSIRPYLMAAFNHFRSELEAGDFLFVLAEQGRCCLLLAGNGCWVSVRTVSGVDDSAALARVIDREYRLQQVSGAPISRVYLHAPGNDEVPVGLAVQPRMLSMPLPRMALRDALYVMAQAVN